MVPVVWTIAGSDSGGGAGIQADLKAFNIIGVSGCSVITAITAQNSVTVLKIECVSEDDVQAQITALADDLPPVAVKIGMLGSVGAIRAVAKFLQSFKGCVVCDPVMVTTTGCVLTDEDVRAAFVEHILPFSTVITPNAQEARKILRRESEIVSDNDFVEAAKALQFFEHQVVVVTGGDYYKRQFCRDYVLFGSSGGYWLTNYRVDSNNDHGTGCTFSAAVAAYVALGRPMKDALVLAKCYVTRGVRLGVRNGAGHGSVGHRHACTNVLSTDFPWIGDEPEYNCSFKPYKFAAGFCPIVPNSVWVERLVRTGVKTIQLRAKIGQTHSCEADIEEEIRKSVMIAKRFNAVCFINDFWWLAIKHGAEGIHVGQEDLSHEAIRALSLLRNVFVGISVSTIHDAAVAKAFKPSYIGVGPIFGSSNKLEKPAMGVEQLTLIASYSECPVVAIGGISLSNWKQAIDAGANGGVAVISAVMDAVDPEEAVRQFVPTISNFDRDNCALREVLATLRRVRPVIHNITNWVVMEQTANVMLALGASPIMAHEESEIVEILALAKSLVLNIGTLDADMLVRMSFAAQCAREMCKPVVLDPVGASATQFRRKAAIRLLESGAITCVRGNASEIIALASDDIDKVDVNDAKNGRVSPKGVDSVDSSENAVTSGVILSKKFDCVVCISGKRDYVIEGDRVAHVDGGHEMMTRVTGMGCSATCVIASFVAISAGEYFEACRRGCVVMARAGEWAAEKSKGALGEFVQNFLSSLANFESLFASNHTEMNA